MQSMEEILKEGIAAHQAGDLPEAARLYQSALELDPDNASAHNNLGFVLGQQQRWPEAMVHLRAALRLQPDMAMAHSNLGQVLVASGQPEEGLAHLEAAVAAEPGNEVAWDNLARIRILAGDFQGGEYAALRAHRLLPGEPAFLTRIGTAVAAQGRYGEALEYLEEAIRRDRLHAEAWAQAGMVRFLRNDLGSAQEALETALSLNPEDGGVLRHLALVRLSLGDRPGAMSLFERLLALQPADHVSRLDLAVLLLSDQRPQEALAQLDRIPNDAAGAAKYRFYRGLALQQVGAAEEGRGLLEALAKSEADGYGEKARALLRTQ